VRTLPLVREPFIVDLSGDFDEIRLGVINAGGSIGDVLKIPNLVLSVAYAKRGRLLRG